MSHLFKSFICRQVCEKNISVVAEISEIIWQMLRIFNYFVSIMSKTFKLLIRRAAEVIS